MAEYWHRQLGVLSYIGFAQTWKNNCTSSKFGFVIQSFDAMMLNTLISTNVYRDDWLKSIGDEEKMCSLSSHWLDQLEM